MNVKFCVKISSNVNTPFGHFGWRDDRFKNASSGYIFIANGTKAQKCTANIIYFLFRLQDLIASVVITSG